MRRLLCRLLLSPHARVKCSGYRHLRDYCDYEGRMFGPHYRVRFYAYAEGRIWGQSCRRHAAALARDLVATGREYIDFSDVGPMAYRDRARDYAPVPGGGP